MAELVSHTKRSSVSERGSVNTRERSSSSLVVAYQQGNVTASLCFSIFSAVVGTGLVFGYETGVLNNPSVSLQIF